MNAMTFDDIRILINKVHRGTAFYMPEPEKLAILSFANHLFYELGKIEKPEWCEHCSIMKDGNVQVHFGVVLDGDFIFSSFEHDIRFCPLCGKRRPEETK